MVRRVVSAMAELKLRLLGGFELEGSNSKRLPTRKAEALLSYLAMPAGREHSREKLASLLWGDWSDVKARHSLAQTLHLIRKTIGANGSEVLQSDSRRIAVNASCVEVDVATFETLVARKTTDAFARAAPLYKGNFLSGIHVQQVAFEAWLVGEQRRLHNMAVDALEALLQQQFDQDEDDNAVTTALQLLTLDPLNESVHRTLMLIHYRADRRQAAIRQYLSCAEQLNRELGIEPDEETTRLYREISNSGARCTGHAVTSDANGRTVPATTSSPDMPSIAVLPFKNISREADQEYIGDGIAEDLITALSKFRPFFVIARNSSFSYKGKETAFNQITHELGVRYVIEGSVRKAGNRVRITSQLIDAETNNHLWADRYDRTYSDLFHLQDDMAATIVGAIEPQLSTSERRRARRKHPENLNAWEYYQRALWHQLRRRKEDEKMAGRLFQNAIEADPDFSLAYAGVAEHFRRIVFSGWTKRPEQFRQNAMEAACMAVSLDDKDAYAHCALGRMHTMQGDYDAAISELEESIQLNPNLAMAKFALGYAFTWFGRAKEALPLFNEAIRQSPRDPQRMSMETMIGYSHLILKEYEDAILWLKKSSRGPVANPWGRLGLAAALVALERKEEAQSAIYESLRGHPGLCLKTVAALLRPRFTENNERYLDYLRVAGLPD